MKKRSIIVCNDWLHYTYWRLFGILFGLDQLWWNILMMIWRCLIYFEVLIFLWRPSLRFKFFFIKACLLITFCFLGFCFHNNVIVEYASLTHRSLWYWCWHKWPNLETIEKKCKKIKAMPKWMVRQISWLKATLTMRSK